MYQFESRIRYSETGEDGCLTLTGMINYLQDCRRGSRIWKISILR